MLENLNAEQVMNDYLIPWGVNILMAIIIFIVGRIVVRIIVSITRKLLQRASMESILVEFVSSITNVILLLFVVIASLDQLGVNTTSLIALIGAAGLAIGLALQSSLQNFAAGVMLIVFRPFKTGDFIEAGGTAGVVEKINLFSTTMRTGDNREVIVPNGNIYGDTITNNSARDTRRIDMVFGIGYNDDIRKARDIMQGILDTDERVLDDPEPLIAVSELADSSVNFIVRPWVKSSDYFSTKCDLIENIKLAFDEHGISIPFPQMDVHLGKD
ncbi:MAG: small-conductance mechanosensitive channel MscS [Gammaproteobacteria bacterium]|nr:MAG: small-conductance mechanosensitive channel MscS [Gammaproteobacteria bacterium]